MSGSSDDGIKVDRRLEYCVYGAALFSNSLGYMIMVVVPLWVIELDAAPLMVGIILGARHMLVLFYSIHGGAMMDRLDVRQVMITFTGIGVTIPLLYPLLPYTWAAIFLQVIAGYCTAMGWIGAQSIIGQVMKGSAVHTGRMSAVVRVGALVGPPIAGAAWDFGGPWGGFAALSGWGLGLFTACCLLPAPKNVDERRPRPQVRDLVPRAADYLTAFKLLAIPLVGVIMAVALLRIAGFGIQASFYTVILEREGYSGTVIGLLLAIYALAGGGTSLMTGPLTRIFHPVWLMIAMVALSVTALSATPALGTFALLAIAAAVNGGAYGLSQPLMISLVARVVGPENQGKAVGLRTTANRLAASFMPVIMGAIVEAAGLEWGFYITGAGVLAMLVVLAIGARGIIRKNRV